MNNVKKDQLVGFLRFAIDGIDDNDIKIELGKILDKVNDDQQLADENINYIVDNTFDKVNGPDFNDEDAKKAISKICDEYNESLSNSLSNSDSDNGSDSDNDSDNDNATEEDDDDVEITRLESKIAEIGDLEKQFISDNVDLLKGEIPNKLGLLSLSDSDREDRKNQLSSITTGDALNTFIDNNFVNETKNELLIDVLNKEIDDLKSQSDDLENTIGFNENNKYLIANLLAKKLYATSVNGSNNDKNKGEMAIDASNLRHDIKSYKVDIDKLSQLASKYSFDKGQLVIEAYELELTNIDQEINALKQIEMLQQELKKSIDARNSFDPKNPFHEDSIDKENKKISQIKYNLKSQYKLIRNLKSSDIVKINEFIDKEKIDLLMKDDIINIKSEEKYREARKANFEKYISDGKEKLKDYNDIQEKIIAKEKLKSNFSDSRDFKKIVSLYDKIINDIVDKLKDDDDFKKLSKKEKIESIGDLVDKNENYIKIKSFPDELVNKEKLANELNHDIAVALNLKKNKKKKKKKKKKKIKVTNNKKKWYKSIAFWGGAALGVGLSFVVVPGTAGLILSGSRLAYSLGKKFIKSYAKKHEGKDTRLMRIINKVTDTKDKFKEKHPRITAAVSKVNNFFKKPSVQYFMNGVAVGYTVGKIGQSVANIFDDSPSKGGGTNSSGGAETTTEASESTAATTETQKPTVADYDVSDTVDKIAKGQRLDVSGVDNGYGFDSSTMDNRVHLNPTLTENVKIVKTKVVNGVKMVLTKSTDGDKLAWFREDDILDVLTAGGKAAGRK